MKGVVRMHIAAAGLLIAPSEDGGGGPAGSDVTQFLQFDPKGSAVLPRRAKKAMGLGQLCSIAKLRERCAARIAEAAAAAAAGGGGGGEVEVEDSGIFQAWAAAATSSSSPTGVVARGNAPPPGAPERPEPAGPGGLHTSTSVRGNAAMQRL
jgi:hypothetical protein